MGDADAAIDNGSIRISLYAHNIANRYIYSTGTLIANGVTGETYVQGYTVNQRMFGLSVDWEL